MNILTMARNIILGVGWPILILGSLYLFIKGRHTYKLVKGSLVGKVVKAMVAAMLVEMYSLGIVSTFYMFCAPKQGVFVVFPVFLVWFIMFVWSLKVLINAEKEITGGAKS
ncbi:MAG: hypothetical protein V1688_03740 [bacterium]